MSSITGDDAALPAIPECDGREGYCAGETKKVCAGICLREAEEVDEEAEGSVS